LEVISLACEPVVARDGITMRTIEDVRVEAIVRGVAEDISWSSVQRILSEGEIRPHLVQGWMHSPDPQFRERVTEITELYLNPPRGSTVICVDEKPGMQALQRRFPDKPARPGRRPRREWEYKRHGTQTLIAGFNVHTGKVSANCGDQRRAVDLVRFMEQLAAEYPTGVVHIIWDNLNIHYDGKEDRWTRFNQRHAERFVFHYTPKHASWVNQVELFFSILQRKSLAHGSFPSVDALRSTVLDFISYWNRAAAHPFRWTFTGYPLQARIDLPRTG
jgi:transposase